MRTGRRDIERLATCFRCQTTNTEQVGLSFDLTDLVYSAWCWTCKNHYHYRLRIETVWDRKGRI